MKKFYVAENSYGSQTSRGFANTWDVLVFDCKKNAKKYVNESKNITVKIIKKTEVIKYAKNWNLTKNCYTEPKKFSSEYWGITNGNYDINMTDVTGYVGQIAVCNDDSYGERFYK